MKFSTKGKNIYFGFGTNGPNAEEYKRIVGHYHTGIDYANGYGSPVYSENYAIVYKIDRPEDNADNWCGVYVLCPDEKEGWVEICFGHLSTVYVKEGDLVREGQVVGLEGNRGLVYSGSERITPQMQRNGDKRGAHVHYQFRPVRKVKTVKSSKHYLNKNGRRYKDAQGFYYEITYNNDTNGCVNPYLYVIERNSLPVDVVNKLLAFFNIK